jgi:hypothetical protein
MIFWIVLGVTAFSFVMSRMERQLARIEGNTKKPKEPPYVPQPAPAILWDEMNEYMGKND